MSTYNKIILLPHLIPFLCSYYSHTPIILKIEFVHLALKQASKVHWATFVELCILFLSIMHSTPYICKAWHHHPHNSTHFHRTPNLRQSQFPLNVHKHKQQKNNNATLKKRNSSLLPRSSSFHNLPSLAMITLAKVSTVILCLIIHALCM
jgi:hypothetical protein